MRKCVLTAGLVLVLVVLISNTADAQPTTPFIAVYFDDTYQNEASPVAPNPCPGVGVLDTLYVMLVNTNAFVSGVEFQIVYPPALTWLADLNLPPVTLGMTLVGISMGWGLPQNGFPDALRPFGGIRICEVLVSWNCGACDQQYLNNPIVVKDHPGSPATTPEWTDFPGFVVHTAVGLTSLVCATIPTEETTWGKVKALYSQ